MNRYIRACCYRREISNHLRLGGDDSAFKSDLETPLREALNGIVITEYNSENLKMLVKTIKPVVSKLVSANAPTSTTV